MFTINPANQADLPVILAMRDEAARWLAAAGSDQWQRPWPDDDTQAVRISQSLAAGETWMVRAGQAVAATITVDRYADPHLWTPQERDEPAAYVRRLIVARAYGGLRLGAQILDWTVIWAASARLTWLRADVWSANHSLQNYYRQHGWTHLRTVAVDDYPSGALFQKPVPRSAKQL